MGRDRLQQSKIRLPPFVAMTWELLNSTAYKELQPNASKALPFFLGKPKATYGTPQYLTTVFSFTYPEAKKLGFAQATWARVLRDLVENGFIDPVRKGGLRGNGKSASQFCLADRWKKYGQHEFESIDLKTWGT